MTESARLQTDILTPTCVPVTSDQNRNPEKLALIIPTLNEAANIGTVLDHVRAVLDPVGFAYEIVVVDDDSQDATGAIVQESAASDPRIRLLVRRGQRGLSGAVLHGWQNTDAGILGVMDADLQHPPALLADLLAAVRSGADLVIGSRYIQGGELGDWNFMRKMISATATMVTLPIQHRGCRAKDPMSGFFMLRAECIKDVALQNAGFKLLLEVLVRAHLRSVREVPISFGLRQGGASKASFKVAWDYGTLLLRLYAARFLRW